MTGGETLIRFVFPRPFLLARYAMAGVSDLIKSGKALAHNGNAKKGKKKSHWAVLLWVGSFHSLRNTRVFGQTC
jgi:hypothetical protein